MERREADLPDPQHARLCAWLLGELDDQESAAVEAELERDPALRAERARVERTIGRVRSIGAEPRGLAPERRARLEAAVGGRRARRVRAAAAVLLLGGLAGAVVLGSEVLGGQDGERETAQSRPVAALPVRQAGAAPAPREESHWSRGRTELSVERFAYAAEPTDSAGVRQPAIHRVEELAAAASTNLRLDLPVDSAPPAATPAEGVAVDRYGAPSQGAEARGGAAAPPVDVRGYLDLDADLEPVRLPSFDPDAFFRACRPRPDERPRDMFFRFWGDNAFVLTREDGLATFAADVDTASFVLARRYLRDGVLPERAQVRTEEFVNFFDPDLPPPADGDLAVHTELAPSPFGGSSARYLLRVGLRARVVPQERREALALTFVVDTSGSMREDQRLELVKHALLTLVSKLDARDRIGIVAFADDARLVLPMTAADSSAEIAAVVAGLQPHGSTNAEAGLKLGYELAASGLDPERHSRVVFLSDGVANVGQTDQDRIAADVRERRESGILLNTIGVGMGNHNDVFLEQLADRGDGVCDYVDDARAVQRAIVERFTGAFQPVAADVKIQVEFADRRVLRWRQLGYENRAVADQDFRNDAVDAGEIGSGHQVTALFELECALDPGDPAPWGTVRVRWLPPRRVGDDPATRVAHELEHTITPSALADAFDTASPAFRRAALVAQFAEVLRRSTHAAPDSYDALKTAVQQLARLPEFATDADTAELVTLVQRAEDLGITHALDRSDLAQACDGSRRHQDPRHQLTSLAGEPRDTDLTELRRQNDELEARIRRLARDH